MPDMPKIDVRPDLWEIVRGILQKHVPQYAVWAFGSRAKWTAKQHSDLDLAVITDKPLPLAVSAALADDFSESDLPWRVDVVDWAATSESFREIIERDKVVVQETQQSLGIAGEWREVALGKLFKVKHGFAFKGEYFTDEPQKTVLVTPGNFAIGGGFQDDKRKYYRGPIPQDYVLKPGQVVVTMTDLSKESDTLGYAATVPCDDTVWLHNQRVGLLEFNPDVPTSPRFIQYLLRTHEYRSWIVGSATGTTVKHTSPGRVESFATHVPPLEEQRAIAHILGTLDDRIELNRRMNQTLEVMARTLFKSWFVDFDGVPPEDMQESELGLIPKGWRVGTIEDLCKSIASGGTPARNNQNYWNDGTIPWFKTGELLDGPLLNSEERITEAALQNSSCKLWPRGTILFALYASPTVGRLGILAKPSTSNQAAAGLIAKDSIGLPFLQRTLIQAREKLQNIAVGAAQQNINLGILKAHRVILPPEGVADRYSKLIESSDEKQAELIKQSHTLAQLRDTLLPKLISGELRVKDAERIAETA